MTTITLESGRTYGVLFDVPCGETMQVQIEGVSAQNALALRPDGRSETLAITDGVMDIPSTLTDTASYVQLSIGSAMFGFRVVAPKTSGRALFANNLLDNSDFACPINQRALTEYIGIGYTIDRWKNVTPAGTISVIEGGIEFKTTSSTSASILQYLSETDRIYYGKTYTFAIGLMDGNVYTVTATYPDTKPTGSKKLATFSMPGGEISIHTRANRPAPYVQINLSKGEPPLHLAWAAVYEGAMDAQSLPAYQPKGYAAERAECERYYARIPSTSEHAQPYYDVTKHFPEMQTTPTAKIADKDGTLGGISVLEDETEAVVHALVTLSVLSKASVRVTCQGGAGVYTYSYIELNADL